MKYQLEEKLKTVPAVKCVIMGYSPNVHRRRREFRRKAKELRKMGGSSCFAVSLWALYQARTTR